MNHPEIHAAMRGAAAVLRLPLRRDRFAAGTGAAAGRGTGSSLEFHDHRLYAPGDDPRHINWQASARTGETTLKTWREEVSPRVDLVVDHSASMFLTAAKARRVWELAYFALEATLRAGGHPRVVLLARRPGAAPEEVATGEALAHRWPDAAAVPGKRVALSADLARVGFRPGSFRVVVSDLLDAGSPEDAVLPLAAAAGRAILLVPFAASERDPDWSGNVEIEDCESGARRLGLVDEALLARYRAAWERHFAAWRGAAARRGIGMARVGDGGTFLEAMRAEALPGGIVETG